MTQYTLIDPVTGKRWFSSEDWLTRNLQHNCILLRDNEHLGVITHRDLVAFIRWCAGEAIAQLKGKPDKSVSHALSLVDRWLEDECSVTSEELRAAAAVTWAQTISAVHQGLVAWSVTAQTSWAARASASTSDVASLVTEAAWAANDTYISLESQTQWFLEHLRSGK